MEDLVYSTRFQGSKRRVLPWLLPRLEAEMKEGTFLDLFVGSGLVSYGMARAGRSVAGADRLRSSGIALQAFLGNKSTLQEGILDEVEPVSRKDKLFSLYCGVFYPDDELLWLLGAAERGRALRGDRRSAFFWALFQAALAKRPYNLFHRANLDMRTRSVSRSFGNARTWERPFPELVARFLREQKSRALPGAPRPQFFCGDVARLHLPEADLVYIDPPYVPARGEPIDYTDFYGFLDLLLSPSSPVESGLAHKPLQHSRSLWEKRATFLRALQSFVDSRPTTTIALSYRVDGFPDISELRRTLGEGTKVYRQPIRYALSHRGSEEVLLLRRGNQGGSGRA